MLHSKGLFTSHSITQYFILVFQQKKKFQGWKQENKQHEDTKQASEPDSDVGQILE